MKPPTVSGRLVLLIVLTFVIAAATAGPFKLGLEQLIPHSSWLQHQVRYQLSEETQGGEADYRYDLGRASRRYLMLMAIVLFVVLRRWIPWSRLARRGFRGAEHPASHAAFGLALAFLLVVAYAAMLLVTGAASWTTPGAGYVLRMALTYGISACLIALVEELFFRGIVFRAMVHDWSVARALTVSSVIYAVGHCFSGSLMVAPGWQPMVGARLLHTYFTDSAGSMLPDIRLVTGLFLLGWLLGYLYLRTGSLWAPMGVHGGMVFLSKLMKKFLVFDHDMPQWLFGDPTFVVSGVLSWVLLLVALAAAAGLAPRGPLYRRLARAR